MRTRSFSTRVAKPMSGSGRLATSGCSTIQTTCLSGRLTALAPRLQPKSTAIVATSGQTIVTVPEYGLGGYLLVTVNGIVQELSTDYAETNTTTITFTSGLTAGDRILTRML